MACSRVFCISNLPLLPRVLSSRWVAVEGDQATYLVGTRNRKQSSCGRGCLPHQHISSRAKKTLNGKPGLTAGVAWKEKQANNPNRRKSMARRTPRPEATQKK